MTTVNRTRSRETMERAILNLFAEPSGEFENFSRMSVIDFEYLLNKVEPFITKQNTQLREAIPAKIRLMITLRYLATGDSFKSLHFLFKVSSEVISRIVPEVCAALNHILKDQIKMPSSVEEWLEVEKGFNKNFPHAIGAIDGKHIVIRSPAHTGSEYYNYKRTFSIVLMALVDAEYKFLFVDIGSQGRISDGGVFRHCILWQNICDNKLNLPPPQPLPQSNIIAPYTFLADGAFALSTHIMKPYAGEHQLGSSKRVFNETLSRSRVVVENAFGILASRFRIFKKPIELAPEKATLFTMTCVLLHNFLMKSKSSQNIYAPPSIIDTYDNNYNRIQDGIWRNEVNEFGAIRNLQVVPRRPPTCANKIRDTFASYFHDKRNL